MKPMGISEYFIIFEIPEQKIKNEVHTIDKPTAMTKNSLDSECGKQARSEAEESIITTESPIQPVDLIGWVGYIMTQFLPHLDGFRNNIPSNEINFHNRTFDDHRF